MILTFLGFAFMALSALAFLGMVVGFKADRGQANPIGGLLMLILGVGFGGLGVLFLILKLLLNRAL